MNCNICPRYCNIDRGYKRGFCGMGEKPVVARAFLHMWEEPCISGTRGSGTVFFSGCSLKCIFCQNHEISHGGKGRELSTAELADIFLSLRDQGAHNINLVTPTHFAAAIKEALDIAKGRRGDDSSMRYSQNTCNMAVPQKVEKSQGMADLIQAENLQPDASSPNTGSLDAGSPNTGSLDAGKKSLDIPVVYNTNGYENLDTLRMLEGDIDIYLPDLKYISPDVSKEYSGVGDYFDKASKAILEMIRQTGPSAFDENGLMKRGILVRHLVLPGHTAETLRVLEWIAENLPKDTHVSLMSQYIPCYRACEHPVIGRRLTRFEYDKVVNKFVKLGLNGFVQERESASTQFIPDFNRDEL